MPAMELLEAMGKCNAGLADAGATPAEESLKPSPRASVSPFQQPARPEIPRPA